MQLVYHDGALEIWRDRRRDEFYVYDADKLVRVCPSIGMAHEVAGSV